MLRKVTVLAGPARSGKTSRLLGAYRHELAGGRVGSVLWLTPSHRSATAAAVHLVDHSLRGTLSPNLLTFAQFADRVLAAAAPKMRPISAGLVRTIVKRLIEDASRSGRLGYFAPIAHTSGFFDLVVGFIGELKRLEIWPEELAAGHGRHPGDKDRELCWIYEQYQELLLRHDLYDVQGQFWAARALLRAGKWRPFERLQHVFVDGFTDFTRTEHDVLEILAGRALSLSISLPLEADSPRGDLFVKTRLTLEELGRRHPHLVVEYLPRRPGTVAALGHLERHLFANPKNATPADDTAGIEIVASAGVTHEIELIARRIKGLLVHGENGSGVRVAPNDVLVVFRSLAETAQLVREVFGRFGIPHVVNSARPLESAAIARALATWLRLAAEDWPFRRVLAILAHNYFRPAWPEWRQGRAAVALEQLVRELEISSGRDELVRSVERLAARAAAEAGAKRRLSPELLRAQLAMPLLRKMCDALDRLPTRATADHWAKSLCDFAQTVGLFDAADASPIGDEAAIDDRLAWQRLLAALAEIQRLSRWTAQEPPRWSRREFVDVLEDLLRHEPLPSAGDETGTVRVLSAEAARNLSAPYVFLGGLAEKAFPPANRDDCLYSDAERRQLAAAGLPFASHALDSRFEMLLFYEVVTRATRRLVLSYPALDPAAQPLTPSPYLSEVQRACGPGRIKKNTQPHLTSVPVDDDVRSMRDFRVLAVSRALEGDQALLAELCAHPATREAAGNVLAALMTSEARRGKLFGPFEGMLVSPAAGQKLAERFGPKRCWSPSQLEQYAYCPFQFFLDGVLHASPVTEPELAVDYMQRGRMLHWLLSTAHRRLNELAGGPSSPGAHEQEPFMEIVRSLVDELRDARGGRALDGGLAEIDLRKIVQWIAGYYHQHAGYDRQWNSWQVPMRPAHFEVSFGPKPGDGQRDEAQQVLDESDPLSTLDPFELDCAGETIRFAGRIDRIDLGQFGEQAVFSILDYKSGAGSKRTSLQAVLAGDALQLPLYALAAEWLVAGRQAAPFRAAYWHVAGKGYQEKDALKFLVVADGRLAKSPEWQALESKLRVRLRSLVAGIRGGQFPMHSADDECTGRCPFNTVCRVNQVRSLEKTWQPPGEENQ
ncbi:MAG: PD-(D/E)XK nuclease family protein [Pirellulales bacterium]